MSPCFAFGRLALRYQDAVGQFGVVGNYDADATFPDVLTRNFTDATFEDLDELPLSPTAVIMTAIRTATRSPSNSARISLADRKTSSGSPSSLATKPNPSRCPLTSP